MEKNQVLRAKKRIEQKLKKANIDRNAAISRNDINAAKNLSEAIEDYGIILRVFNEYNSVAGNGTFEHHILKRFMKKE